VRHVLRAVAHDELHAIATHRFQVGAAHDERDVVAGQCNLDPNVAADGASTDDRDFHRTLLKQNWMHATLQKRINDSQTF